MREPVEVYMDGICWEHEVGNASGGNRVFPSVADLKKSVQHDTSECGIAKVRIVFVEWAEEPK